MRGEMKEKGSGDEKGLKQEDEGIWKRRAAGG